MNDIVGIVFHIGSFYFGFMLITFFLLYLKIMTPFY